MISITFLHFIWYTVQHMSDLLTYDQIRIRVIRQMEIFFSFITSLFITPSKTRRTCPLCQTCTVSPLSLWKRDKHLSCLSCSLVSAMLFKLLPASCVERCHETFSDRQFWIGKKQTGRNVTQMHLRHVRSTPNTVTQWQSMIYDWWQAITAGRCSGIWLTHAVRQQADG